jgi:hypothetical protein
MKGNISLEKSLHVNPFPSWLPEQGWQDLLKLSSLHEVFGNLSDHVIDNEEEWKKCYNDPTPEVAEIPLGYQEKLDPL